MQDTLVFGASGFLGRHLVERLGAHRVLGTSAQSEARGTVHFDGASFRLKSLLRPGHGIRTAILLHGITDMEACARRPDRTRPVNVTGMQRLLDDLAQAGIRTLYASTDAVFDGGQGHYAETDLAEPIIAYGREKREVERFIENRRLPVLVLRFAKMVAATPGTHSLFGEWLHAIDQERTIRCAADQVFSPLAVGDAADLVARLAETDATGLLHVAGPVRCTRLELFNIFHTEVLRHRPGAPAAEPCSIRDFPFSEPRPLDTSLRIDRLRRILSPDFESMQALARRVADRHFASSSSGLPVGTADFPSSTI